MSTSARISHCRACGGELGTSFLYTADGFVYHHECFPGNNVNKAEAWDAISAKNTEILRLRAENERLTMELAEACAELKSAMKAADEFAARALAAEAREAQAVELQRAANALLNNLWQDVWSGKRTYEENWEAFDKQYPGVKWLHDELTVLSALASLPKESADK